MSKYFSRQCLTAFVLIWSFFAAAGEKATPINQHVTSQQVVDACIAQKLKTVDKQTTVAELEQQCQNSEQSLIATRKLLEASAEDNPFAILPHKPTYFLPVTYANTRIAPYAFLLGEDKEPVDNLEAKFQISLKHTIAHDVFVEDLDMYAGYTAVSWWQVYNSELSEPFRENNYELELIFDYNKTWQLFGVTIDDSFISINHESNGQGGELSRSWNRIIGGVAFTTGDFVWGIKSWYRIPEKEKSTPDSPNGDDNPDIHKYMGYGELGVLWRLPHGHSLDLMLRNNLNSDNKGAVKLGWSFPLSQYLRAYVEYFNGYGESLIYYDQHIQRFGVGVKFTDWL